jgi:hypothetical protein
MARTKCAIEARGELDIIVCFLFGIRGFRFRFGDCRLYSLDEGVSGTRDAVDRPAFIEMLAALHSNGTKLVLIEKLDRWARDLMVQETILAELRKNGFDLVSVEEPDQDPGRCTTSKWHSRDCWVLSHAWRYARAWTRFLCG